MKLIILVFATILLFKSEETNAQTYDSTSIEYLASESFKALQDDNFENFKKLSMTLDIYQTQDSSATAERFEDLLRNLFDKSKEGFLIKNVPINDLSFHHCDTTPQKEYIYNGFILVRFYAYFENSSGKMIKIQFSDSIKTSDGYKLSEALVIKAK
jgi:hypothetical protein